MNSYQHISFQMGRIANYDADASLNRGQYLGQASGKMYWLVTAAAAACRCTAPTTVPPQTVSAALCTESATEKNSPVLPVAHSPASVDSNSSYSIDAACHPITPDNIIVEETGDYLLVDRGHAFTSDVQDGAGRKRSLPPLSLPLAPVGSGTSIGGSTGPPSADSPYLSMVISPGRQTAPPATGADAPAYLPMVIAPGGGGDTPDGYITSPSE